MWNWRTTAAESAYENLLDGGVEAVDGKGMLFILDGHDEI